MSLQGTADLSEWIWSEHEGNRFGRAGFFEHY